MPDLHQLFLLKQVFVTCVSNIFLRSIQFNPPFDTQKTCGIECDQKHKNSDKQFQQKVHLLLAKATYA